jgi:hypothetical protein
MLIASLDANVLVPHNRMRLPAHVLDVFAVELWDSSPSGVATVVDTLVNKRRQRPVTRAEMLESIRKHMPLLVTRLSA